MLNKKSLLTAVLPGILLTCSMLAGCFIKDFSLNGDILTYKDSSKYSVGNASLDGSVNNIEIDWINGDINVSVSGSDTIDISETCSGSINDNDDMLHYYLDGSTLYIKYCASGHSITGSPQKSLTVTVPDGTNLNNFKADVVTSNINIADISINKLVIDSVSGNINAHIPALNSFDIECVSANTSISSPAAPDKGDIDTVSGNIELIIPDDSDFSVSLDSISGNIISEIKGMLEDDEFICGKGTSKYNIESVSGDVCIKKY